MIAYSLYKELVQKIVEDGEFFDFTSGYLYEYLLRNIKGLEDVRSEYVKVEHPEQYIRDHHLKIDGPYQYSLWQDLGYGDSHTNSQELDTSDGDFVCVTEDTVYIGDAIKAKEEVICFKSHVENSHNDICYWKLVKEQVNENGAFYEKYIPGMKVETEISSPEFFEEVIKKVDMPDRSNGRISSQTASFVNYPLMASGIKEEKKRVIASCNPIKSSLICMIEYYEGDKLIETFRSTGKSLYTAYYDYMVDKGYFINNGMQKRV